MNVGDLLGSGTITGTEPGSDGSMLELSENGNSRLRLQDGQERTFLEDHDTVTSRAALEKQRETWWALESVVGRSSQRLRCSR